MFDVRLSYGSVRFIAYGPGLFFAFLPRLIRVSSSGISL
jgi:hypothetical protein